MLDFRVDTFVQVCRFMNFTKAAKELNITQPAVSQHIRFLEGAYGAELFTYRGKKLSLTPEGEALLNAVVTMKHDLQYLKEEMQGIRGKKKKLSFGATLTAAEYMIPELVAEYLAHSPGTSARLRVANTHELLEELDGGQIDFALVEGYFEPEKYDCLLYRRESYVGVCAPFHPLARAEGAALQELFKERLIIREAGSGTREILEKHLALENRSVRNFASVTEIGNIGVIKQLTAGGAGVTFLYEAAVKRELEEGTLRKIDLEDFRISHDITFVWRKNSIFSEEYHEMFKLLGQ